MPAGSASMLGGTEEGGLVCETVLGAGVGGRDNEGECKSGDGHSQAVTPKARRVRGRGLEAPFAERLIGNRRSGDVSRHTNGAGRTLSAWPARH
ncbi:hypothetical protein FRC12_007744 [Ceratobasidium sp. 428]|nr:hypothetical protein FRC12_007744 [Ceratobasidium sp. 428]